MDVKNIVDSGYGFQNIVELDYGCQKTDGLHNLTQLLLKPTQSNSTICGVHSLTQLRL